MEQDKKRVILVGSPAPSALRAMSLMAGLEIASMRTMSEPEPHVIKPLPQLDDPICYDRPSHHKFRMASKQSLEASKKIPLTKRQVKSRKKNKQAKQSRRRNRR